MWVFLKDKGTMMSFTINTIATVSVNTHIHTYTTECLQYVINPYNMHTHTHTPSHIGNPGRPLQTFGANRARRLIKASVTNTAIYWGQNYNQTCTHACNNYNIKSASLIQRQSDACTLYTTDSGSK